MFIAAPTIITPRWKQRERHPLLGEGNVSTLQASNRKTKMASTAACMYSGGMALEEENFTSLFHA